MHRYPLRSRHLVESAIFNGVAPFYSGVYRTYVYTYTDSIVYIRGLYLSNLFEKRVYLSDFMEGLIRVRGGAYASNNFENGAYLGNYPL